MKPYQHTERAEPRSWMLTHLVHRLAIGYIFEVEIHCGNRTASRVRMDRKALEDEGLYITCLLVEWFRGNKMDERWYL